MLLWNVLFNAAPRESLFNFIVDFFCAQDVNVMNMLMIISWKGSALLKTHPSCSTVGLHIFYAHTFSFIVRYVQFVTWENLFFVANFFASKETFFFSLLKQTIAKTKVSSWCENNQSKWLRVPYIYQVLCQQYQVHWKFMSFLIIITLWCSLCGDKLRYDWNLSFLLNLFSSSHLRN